MPTEQPFHRRPEIGETVYIAGFVFNTQQPYLEEHRLTAIGADEVTTEHLASYKGELRESGIGTRTWPLNILDYLSVPLEQRIEQQAAQLNDLCQKIIKQAGRTRA